MAASPSSPPPDGAHGRRLKRIRRLSHWLDDRFRVPGTEYRVGLDGIIGLIPGVGDSATTLLSLYILSEAWQAGVGWPKLLKMAWNLLIDLVVGAIPLVGDLFDFGWKANLKNLRLLEEDIQRRQAGL